MRSISALQLIACLIASTATAGVNRTPVTLAEHSVNGGAIYYTVGIALPTELRQVERAWIELKLSIDSVAFEGMLDPAPLLEVYPVTQAFDGPINASQLDVSNSMSRPVAIGTGRMVKIDITAFVRRVLVDPSMNRGLVLGSVTGASRGVFSVVEDSFGPDVDAQLVIVE